MFPRKPEYNDVVAEKRHRVSSATEEDKMGSSNQHLIIHLFRNTETMGNKQKEKRICIEQFNI